MQETYPRFQATKFRSISGEIKYEIYTDKERIKAPKGFKKEFREPGINYAWRYIFKQLA